MTDLTQAQEHEIDLEKRRHQNTITEWFVLWVSTFTLLLLLITGICLFEKIESNKEIRVAEIQSSCESDSENLYSQFQSELTSREGERW